MTASEAASKALKKVSTSKYTPGAREPHFSARGDQGRIARGAHRRESSPW
jgi:hypothetical protein